MKRLFDVTLASAGLVAAAPIVAATAVLVRQQLGTPILFRQTRLGQDGVPFELTKFRSMRDGTGSDAERLTPFGRFLRASSLDELPQLLNVIRGDMSLVGPRPLLPRYWSRFSDAQRRRHIVKPGLTGWSQILGRNLHTWDEKLALDTWYAEHWSNALDVKILLRTIGVVVKQRGVSHAGEATMPEFMGPGTR